MPISLDVCLRVDDTYYTAMYRPWGVVATVKVSIRRLRVSGCLAAIPLRAFMPIGPARYMFNSHPLPISRYGASGLKSVLW
jgi:hypothetical protein